MQTFARPRIKWFGVNASGSSGSSLAWVIGRAYNVCSPKHMKFSKTSSVRDRFPYLATIVFLRLLTKLSHTSPKCGSPCGLNFYTTWFEANSEVVIWPWFHELMYSFNSLADPTKLVPLSLMTVLDLPRLAKNLLETSKQESVSWLRTTSMCTALVVKHVNKHYLRFIEEDRKNPSHRWLTSTIDNQISRSKSATSEW